MAFHHPKSFSRVLVPFEGGKKKEFGLSTKRMENLPNPEMLDESTESTLPAQW